MPNLRLLFNDQVGSATISASTTAGALVAANVQTNESLQIWRATATSATLTLTWATAVSLSSVVLGWTNLSPSAVVTVSRYTEVADAVPIDSVVVGADIAQNGRSAAQAWFSTPASVRKIVIEITGNAANIEIGRVLAGVYYELARNPSFGASLSWKDTSKTSRAESGAARQEAGYRYRSVTLSLSMLFRTDALQLRLIAQRGLGAIMFIALYPGSADAYEQGWSFLALITQEVSESISTAVALSSSLTFEEAL